MATHNRKKRVRTREIEDEQSGISARPRDEEEEHTHEREIVTESGLSVAPEDLAVGFLAHATAQDNLESMQATADTDLEIAASPTDEALTDERAGRARELWGRMVEFVAARFGRDRDEE